MQGFAFDVDEKTGQALDALSKVYGTPTRASTIRRALAINMAASRYVNKDGILRLRDMRPGAAPEAEVHLPVR